MFKLNPTVLLVILIGIGFQTAFSQSITLNIIVAVVGLLYLLLQRVSGKVIVIMLLVAAPLAFGTWWSFIAFGTGDTHRIALVYASRLYAYLLLGAALTLTTHVKDLLISLHLHAKLSSTFTYGLYRWTMLCKTGSWWQLSTCCLVSDAKSKRFVTPPHCVASPITFGVHNCISKQL